MTMMNFSHKNEFTAALSSKQHCCIHKALIISPSMAHITIDIINEATLNGYLLQRWQEIINTMLEKNPVSPKLTRFRIIHILEADWKFFNKHKYEYQHSLTRKQINTHEFSTNGYNVPPNSYIYSFKETIKNRYTNA